MILPKTHILSFLFVLITSSLLGQINLISNGSFEHYDTLPNHDGQIHKAIGWNNLEGKGSIDYYHAQSFSDNINYPDDFQNNAIINPRTTSAIVGMYLWISTWDHREYLNTKLLEPLKTGLSYELIYYVHDISIRENGFNYKNINAIQVYFTNEKPNQIIREILYKNPQITPTEVITTNNEWKK